jgi:quaternary ammonium compound-resistance protein SugE
MAWVVLVLSGVLEAVWATALGRSQGFTRLGPTVVFLVAVIASMVGLAHALRSLPVGTAYAVWVGIGAVGTALYAILVDGEPASVLKILCLVGIIACVGGLKLAS